MQTTNRTRCATSVSRATLEQHTTNRHNQQQFSSDWKLGLAHREMFSTIPRTELELQQTILAKTGKWSWGGGEHESLLYTFTPCYYAGRATRVVVENRLNWAIKEGAELGKVVGTDKNRVKERDGPKKDTNCD